MFDCGVGVGGCLRKAGGGEISPPTITPFDESASLRLISDLLYRIRLN